MSRRRGQDVYISAFDSLGSEDIAETREIVDGHFGRIFTPDDTNDAGWEVGERDSSKYGGMYWNQGSETLGFGVSARGSSVYSMEINSTGDVTLTGDTDEAIFTLTGATGTRVAQRISMPPGTEGRFEFMEDGTAHWYLRELSSRGGNDLELLDATTGNARFAVLHNETTLRVPGGISGYAGAITGGQKLDDTNRFLNYSNSPISGSFVIDAGKTTSGDIVITGVGGESTNDVVLINVYPKTDHDHLDAPVCTGSQFSIGINTNMTADTTVYWQLVGAFALETVSEESS